MRVWTLVSALVGALVSALVGSRKSRFGRYVNLRQHTCNRNTKNFSYTCMWLHPQFSFMSSQPQTQTRASKLLDGTECEHLCSNSFLESACESLAVPLNACRCDAFCNEQWPNPFSCKFACDSTCRCAGLKGARESQTGDSVAANSLYLSRHVSRGNFKWDTLAEAGNPGATGPF